MCVCEFHSSLLGWDFLGALGVSVNASVISRKKRISLISTHIYVDIGHSAIHREEEGG